MLAYIVVYTCYRLQTLCTGPFFLSSRNIIRNTSAQPIDAQGIEPQYKANPR